MNLARCRIRVSKTYQCSECALLYFLFFSPYWGLALLDVLGEDLFYIGIHDLLFHYLYDPEQL